MGTNIFCIGELLIDMVCVDGKGLKNGVNFEKKAGGAPANVAACISKLEGTAYFLGQVGKDYFGTHLLEILQSLHINIDMVAQDGQTTIALVGIDEKGERNFDFLRGSDGQYAFHNIDLTQIKPFDIIHFGSATAFLEGTLKETYFDLLAYGKSHDAFISFDPNYRDALISEALLPGFIEDSLTFIRQSDFVKVSDQELALLTGKEDLAVGVAALHAMGTPVVTVTLGSKGAYISVNGEGECIPSVPIAQVDSTGAGDAFVGAALKQLGDTPATHRKELSLADWCKIITFANRVGAITCTNYGAIASMPTAAELT